MSAKSEKWKIEHDFYLNKRTKKVQYNKLCERCKKECKQSFRAKVMQCPHYEPKEIEKKWQFYKLN